MLVLAIALSCEMPFAIAAPNTMKSSMLGVDISYIIRSALYPLLLSTGHPARPALGGVRTHPSIHSMIQSPPHSVRIRPGKGAECCRAKLTA